MTSISNTGTWESALPVEELPSGAARMVRLRGRQIALFHTGDGVFACNNRCPHEGYPLSEGTVDGQCRLTCNWHNWKFDLNTGENLLGGDALRTYPVEARDGVWWVNLADPPLESRRAAALAGLRRAFDENDYAWIARELARLDHLETDPAEIIADVVEWSYERFEYGWTHAYAGIDDWLSLFDTAEDRETRLACLLEIVAHVADELRGEPPVPFSEAVSPFEPDAFLAAIENEDEATATAHLRGALVGGAASEVWRDTLETCFVRAAFAHYQDFGHAVIYAAKIPALLRRMPARAAAPLLLSMTRGLVYATREDLIPEFAAYGEALARWDAAGDADSPDAVGWLRKGTGKLLPAVADCAAQPPMVLFETLLALNARVLLGFDTAHQSAVRVPVSKNASWLDVTHGVTFARAVLEIC
ncbi:MAG: Rieske 2Fe-2S domain-containing protein, partial [Pseudomonadota bacterium]